MAKKKLRLNFFCWEVILTVHRAGKWAQSKVQIKSKQNNNLWSAYDVLCQLIVASEIASDCESWFKQHNSLTPYKSLWIFESLEPLYYVVPDDNSKHSQLSLKSKEQESWQSG
jgi:hypothetical protein